jgi:Mrp family chromosome partitioning ATPase
MGAFIGAAIAWVATDRRRVVDPAAAAAALDAPLLGSFGPQRELMRFPRLANLESDRAPGNELKVLSSSLLLSATRRDIGSIVITSARRREGKTVLAANIAAAAQFTGHSAALVDAANGSSSLTDALDLADEPGLSEIFDGGVLRDSVHVFSIGAGDDCTLPVVPVGQKGWRQELGRRLNEKRRASWAAAVRASSPVTAIVDTPAVNAHAIPLQLAQSGGLVVVVSPRTTLSDLELIRMRADVADVAILGFIRNEYRAGARARRSWLRGRAGAQGRLVRRPDLAKPALGPVAVPAAGTETTDTPAPRPSKQEADSLR